MFWRLCSDCSLLLLLFSHCVLFFSLVFCSSLPSHFYLYISSPSENWQSRFVSSSTLRFAKLSIILANEGNQVALHIPLNPTLLLVLGFSATNHLIPNETPSGLTSSGKGNASSLSLFPSYFKHSLCVLKHPLQQYLPAPSTVHCMELLCSTLRTHMVVLVIQRQFWFFSAKKKRFLEKVARKSDQSCVDSRCCGASLVKVPFSCQTVNSVVWALLIREEIDCGSITKERACLWFVVVSSNLVGARFQRKVAKISRREGDQNDIISKNLRCMTTTLMKGNWLFYTYALNCRLAVIYPQTNLTTRRRRSNALSYKNMDIKQSNALQAATVQATRTACEVNG